MTETGVATRYAHALVDAIIAPQSGLDARGALGSLQDFVNLMAESRDLELVLFSPSVNPARKRAVIGRIAARMELPRLVTNFLFVLSDHRRLPLVRETVEAARSILDERLGILRAEVVAAAPLSDVEQRQIAEKFGALTGKQIRLELRIDPGLIGGIVARVGSQVYDGSVRGRLRALAKRLASDEMPASAR